jgi:hypothetical protein
VDQRLHASCASQTISSLRIVCAAAGGEPRLCCCARS